MKDSSNIYGGLDVHKASIAVAVARAGRGEPEYYGEIRNDAAPLRKLLQRIKTDRRDALMRARWHRAGELTAMWVPDQDQEAMRSSLRSRSS